MTGGALADDVAEAAEHLVAARARLVAAMRTARDAGLSYREIGRLAGLSHEAVRRILLAATAD